MDVALFVPITVSLFITFAILLTKYGKAARDRARERRMREHQMNARLLRMDL